MFLDGRRPTRLVSARAQAVSYDKVGKVMMRRFICPGLLLSTLVLGSLGCEPHCSFLRPKDHDEQFVADRAVSDPSRPTAIESDASKIMSVDSDPKDPKPFFKGDRKSGGWSSEAREIEKNLGVN